MTLKATRTLRLRGECFLAVEKQTESYIPFLIVARRPLVNMFPVFIRCLSETFAADLSRVQDTSQNALSRALDM